MFRTVLLILLGLALPASALPSGIVDEALPPGACDEPGEYQPDIDPLSGIDRNYPPPGVVIGGVGKPQLPWPGACVAPPEEDEPQRRACTAIGLSLIHI